MSTALNHNLPEPLLSVRTRPLFVLREAVPPLIVIGQPAKRVAVLVAEEDGPEEDSELAIGGRRGIGRSIAQGQVHHVADEQIHQIDVGEQRGREEQ